MQSVPRRATGPTRDEKKALTRGRLLDAAAAVFARKGFTGASLDDVAEEAGLTKGAVYSNFDSKEDLVTTLIEERLDRPELGIADVVDPAGSRVDQAAQAGDLYMSRFNTDRESFLLGFEFSLHLARNPHLVQRFNQRYRDLRASTADLIESNAAEVGIELPMSKDELATVLLALGAGLTLDRLVDPDNVPADLFGKVLGLLLANPADQRAGKGGKPKR
jgi:AcrR family transcriptional regulator